MWHSTRKQQLWPAEKIEERTQKAFNSVNVEDGTVYYAYKC
jgi:hypothetical protein